MTYKLNVGVKADIGKTSELVDEMIEDLLLDCKINMHDIMTTESSRRSDGLGGRDGAKDSGNLSGSMFMYNDNRKAIVGTRVGYAKTLVTGDPDPTANLYDIADWAKRKDLLRTKTNSAKKYYAKHPWKHPFSRRVWKKIQTEGPVRNPFHLRSVEVFVNVAWPKIVSDWKARWD